MTVTADQTAAGELRPGTQIIFYGGPVYVTDVKGLPEFAPATHVKVTYRKDFAKGHIIGQTVVPAGVTFPLYDDGEAF